MGNGCLDLIKLYLLDGFKVEEVQDDDDFDPVEPVGYSDGSTPGAYDNANSGNHQENHSFTAFQYAAQQHENGNPPRNRYGRP